MSHDIKVGDTVTFSHRHWDGTRTETGVVESFVNNRARVRLSPNHIAEMGISALTRVTGITHVSAAQEVRE